MRTGAQSASQHDTKRDGQYMPMNYGNERTVVTNRRRTCEQSSSKSRSPNEMLGPCSKPQPVAPSRATVPAGGSASTHISCAISFCAPGKRVQARSCSGTCPLQNPAGSNVNGQLAVASCIHTPLAGYAQQVPFSSETEVFGDTLKVTSQQPRHRPAQASARSHARGSLLSDMSFAHKPRQTLTMSHAVGHNKGILHG